MVEIRQTFGTLTFLQITESPLQCLHQETGADQRSRVLGTAADKLKYTLTDH